MRRQLGFAWLRKHKTAVRRLAKMNVMQFAEIADTLEMAEKIQDEEFIDRQGREERSPDSCGVGTKHRFAAFRSEQLKTDGFYIRAKVERLHIQREWRQFQGPLGGIRSSCAAHTSDSVCGKFV